MFKRVLLAMWLTIAFVWQAMAAPQISSVTGTIAHGQVVTIVGSGFGTKTPAAPIGWEDFEVGSSHLGSAVNEIDAQWTEYYDSPCYTSTWAHSGSISVSKCQNTEFAMMYIDGVTPSQEIYVSYWAKTIGIHIGVAGSLKFHRINASVDAGGDANGVYNGAGCQSTGKDISSASAPGPTLNMSYCPTASSCQYYVGAIPFPWNVQEGIRLEGFVRLSNPAGTANGIYQGTSVGYGDELLTGIVNRAAGQSWLLDTGLFSITAANQVGDYGLYMDDCYVDVTRARVEIGNATTFSACTHREIQIPTDWSPFGINVSVNLGTFVSGDTVYFFVVDADGVASNGRQVVLGGGDLGPPGMPMPPIWSE